MDAYKWHSGLVAIEWWCGSFSLFYINGILFISSVCSCQSTTPGRSVCGIIIAQTFVSKMNRRKYIQINFMKLFLLIAVAAATPSLFPFRECLNSICPLNAVAVVIVVQFLRSVIFTFMRFCFCLGWNCLESAANQ